MYGIIICMLTGCYLGLASAFDIISYRIPNIVNAAGLCIVCMKLLTSQATDLKELPYGFFFCLLLFFAGMSFPVPMGDMKFFMVLILLYGTGMACSGILAGLFLTLFYWIMIDGHRAHICYPLAPFVSLGIFLTLLFTQGGAA